MASSETMLSDEEFARQLQREEYGHASLLQRSLFGQRGSSAANAPAPSNTASHDISAPLLNDNAAVAQAADANPLLNDMGGNNANGDNAAQRARRNVIGHVRDADTDSPRILLLRIAIALLEMVATSTVLSIGWDEGLATSCSYLKWWALVYTSRHLLTVPLRIHIYRTNRRPVDADNDDDNEAAGGRAEKSIQVLRWLSIMTFLLFLLGQTFLFTEKSCQSVAPTVWYYCLVIIILVYVSLALPFLIVLAICICLPCVLIIFRFFAEPEGADDRIIKDLPTRKVTAADVKKNRTGDGDTASQEKTQDDGDQEDDDEDDDDAPSCAICMQAYRVDDELRILPCEHEFHCECVDKWLPMKKICPLCRHDITQKKESSGDNRNNNNNEDNV